MATFALETLEVYALSESLADAVWTVVCGWEPFAKRTMGAQLVRAADSVGANIAEGYGRASPTDNRRFVRMARGSLYEVRHFLRRADERELLTCEQKAPLRALMRQLMPALNAYLRSLAEHRV